MSGYGCAACGRNFSSLAGFDRHHYSAVHARPCKDPETARHPKTGELLFSLDRFGRWRLVSKSTNPWASDACPNPQCEAGEIERVATPDEVDAGFELGVFFGPCPDCGAAS